MMFEPGDRIIEKRFLGRSEMTVVVIWDGWIGERDDPERMLVIGDEGREEEFRCVSCIPDDYILVPKVDMLVGVRHDIARVDEFVVDEHYASVEIAEKDVPASDVTYLGCLYRYGTRYHIFRTRGGGLVEWSDTQHPLDTFGKVVKR